MRLVDNTALIEALKLSASVIPCFIFDPRQIENNPYRGQHSVQFMLQSLQELDAALRKKNSKLYLFYGRAEDVIAKLISENNIHAIFFNRDYSPFSCMRDENIKQLCQKSNIELHTYADALLHEPEEVLKSNNQPYTIFTPFFHKAVQLYVAPPHKNLQYHFFQKKLIGENSDIINSLNISPNPDLLVKGGRKEALTLLGSIKNLINYATERNIPSLTSTTKLSAHLKFGTVSVRELYAAITKNFGSQHLLIKELYWRDFFTHIAYHYPQVLGESFQEKYRNIQWQTNKNYLSKWCTGQTGFPIVDAGMRELNTTGYMHNRVRMITASFLTKDLHIDWRVGEKYFAEKLVDYDPSVNNGNWQWAASTGCDAQPYFRIFNPWLQQQKFDPDCIYIKRWLPELNQVPAKVIHKLNQLSVSNYLSPIVNHAVESLKAKAIYKKVKM